MKGNSSSVNLNCHSNETNVSAQRCSGKETGGQEEGGERMVNHLLRELLDFWLCAAPAADAAVPLVSWQTGWQQRCPLQTPASAACWKRVHAERGAWKVRRGSCESATTSAPGRVS